MPMLTDTIREKLSSIQELVFTEINNYPCIEVPKEKILEVAKKLRDECKIDQIRDVVGVDRFTKNDRFECIYNLYSHPLKIRIFLRVRFDSKNPEVESLCPVWSGVNWMEREEYDMFGIIFLNHPDLRRIYMMDEYQYYPLRKDYPLMGLPGAVQLPKK